jgi:hypothetical protein
MAMTLKKRITPRITLGVKQTKVSKVFTLPSAPIEPVSDLGAYSWLIYGQKKIGKSTLASLFPDALFMMFEPGAKALRIYRVDCSTWTDALGYLRELEKSKEVGQFRFKTIVLDTGFEMHKKCQSHICETLNIDYPRENNYGKDWNAISGELRKFHDRIFNLGVGLIILCHEAVKEQQTYTGNKYDQVVPLLAKASDDYYRAVIDNVAWYHYRGKQRFLQIRGTDHAMAGLALNADDFFKTPNGEQIYAIPISSDPSQGMKNILDAFMNKQPQTFKEETEKFSETAIKISINEKLRKAARKGGR